jgi:hypothetical protein
MSGNHADTKGVTDMKTYSNPRMLAVIPDWPSGVRRVVATFQVEIRRDGQQRAIRTTTGAPKKLTYANRMRIVDGDDGRTYIAADHGHGMISIRQSNMQFQEECVHEGNPRYPDLLALFD